MNAGLVFAAIGVMVVALLSIPLGLPGLWIMVGVVAVGLVGGEVSLVVFLALLALAVGAEVAEWAFVDRLGRRYGGTKRTFWGSLVGGALGAIVGTPVPVIGSVAGAFAGTLMGAILVTWIELRHLGGAVRAGWGALLGRAVAVAVKVFAGIVTLIVGGGALLV